MALIILISSFELIWLILLAITFAGGYFIKRNLDKVSNIDKEEIETNRKTIEKLNAELKVCREKGSEYKKELDLLRSEAGKKAKVEPEVDALNSGQNTPDTDENQEAKGDGFLAPGPESDQVKDRAEQVPRRTSKFESLKNSNLQIIEGIGPKMESVLKENGLNEWSHLGNQTQENLRSILETYGNKYKIIDPDSWPEQARYAANGEWSQLVRMQKGFNIVDGVSMGNTPAKVEKVMIKLGIVKEFKQDDLKAIEGIGPKIAELLNSTGINSWEELSKTSVDALQNILDKAGKRYQLADPGSWPKQASLAVEGKFDELSDYQDILQGGV